MRPLRRSRSRPVDVEPDGWGRGRCPSADTAGPEDESPVGDGPDADADDAQHGRARGGRPWGDEFPPEELFPPDEGLPPDSAFQGRFPIDEGFPAEELFPPRVPFPSPVDADDRVSASGSVQRRARRGSRVPAPSSGRASGSASGSVAAAEPCSAATAPPPTPLPGQRTRVRLRVGIGAAGALVGAALVITILVTAYQAAQGGTTTGSASAAGSTSAEHGTPGSSGRGARSSAAEDDAPASTSSGARGDAIAADPDAADAGPGDGSAGDHTDAGSRTPIYVHVVGAVVSPGLFPLAPGSRVVDALAAAHGFADGADPAGVNLARALTDGEQLVVPRQGEAAAPAAPGSAGASATGASPSAPVDLNTATAEQLETLPRVGPSLAGRIIAWRSAHGGFTRVADLGRVPGIGDRTLASLTPLVRV